MTNNENGRHDGMPLVTASLAGDNELVAKLSTEFLTGLATEALAALGLDALDIPDQLDRFLDTFTPMADVLVFLSIFAAMGLRQYALARGTLVGCKGSPSCEQLFDKAVEMDSFDHELVMETAQQWLRSWAMAMELGDDDE